MNLRSALCILTGLAVGTSGFAADTALPPQSPDEPLIRAVAESSTGFAAGLYAQLRVQPGNIAFAPVGLSQALVALAAGTAGTTEAELSKVLDLTVPVVDAADGFAMLSRRLQRAAGGEAALCFARALWVQQWNSINSDFVEVLREHCRSELRVTDFAHAQVAARWMNQWVADRTEAQVGSIVDPRELDTSTRLVVGTAVCFNAGWKSRFDPAQTAVGRFFVTTEPAPVEVSFMRQTALYRLATMPGVRLLQLPYRGDRLAMVVVLPDVTLPPIEDTLTSERIAEYLRSVQQAAPAPLDLRLPRFKAERPLALMMAAVQAMGARQVWNRDGAADFSKFGSNYDSEPVYLSGINHLAKFSVEEQGSLAPVAMAAVPVVVAAAPTAGGAGPAAGAGAAQAQDPMQASETLIIDRPFLYFICDPDTGSVLFMGRVADPREG